MSHRVRPSVLAAVAGASLGAGLLAASAAEAQAPAPPPTVSASGSATALVKPDNRNSNTSIIAAIQRAETEAAPAALRDAQRRVTAVAQAAGLTLTHLVSVSEPEPSPFGPFGGPFGSGTFGPGQYCGTVPRFRTKRLANGRTRRVRVGVRRTCRIPARVTTSLTVTYATG